MSKVYFDDLFLVLDDDLLLCEHVPYETHNILLRVKSKYDYDLYAEDLIYKIILSDDFKALDLNVIGVSHRLSNN